jgi:hypothetical protein
MRIDPVQYPIRDIEIIAVLHCHVHVALNVRVAIGVAGRRER